MKCFLRDQWKSHVSSYHPVFMDGWSPEYPIIDEPDSMVEPKASRDLHPEEPYDFYE